MPRGIGHRERTAASGPGTRTAGRPAGDRKAARALTTSKRIRPAGRRQCVAQVPNLGVVAAVEAQVSHDGCSDRVARLGAGPVRRRTPPPGPAAAHNGLVPFVKGSRVVGPLRAGAPLSLVVGSAAFGQDGCLSPVSRRSEPTLHDMCRQSIGPGPAFYMQPEIMYRFPIRSGPRRHLRDKRRCGRQSRSFCCALKPRNGNSYLRRGRYGFHAAT
jgi:hypothetical protein